MHQWKLPPKPKPIILEYDYLLGEDDKCGYLTQQCSVGDILGVLDSEGNPVIHLYFDEYLYLSTISNNTDLKVLKSGQELYRLCNVIPNF